MSILKDVRAIKKQQVRIEVPVFDALGKILKSPVESYPDLEEYDTFEDDGKFDIILSYEFPLVPKCDTALFVQIVIELDLNEIYNSDREPDSYIENVITYPSISVGTSTEYAYLPEVETQVKKTLDALIDTGLDNLKLGFVETLESTLNRALTIDKTIERIKAFLKGEHKNEDISEQTQLFGF